MYNLSSNWHSNRARSSAICCKSSKLCLCRKRIIGLKKERPHSEVLILNEKKARYSYFPLYYCTKQELTQEIRRNNRFSDVFRGYRNRPVS